jgi:hypothetical protein
MRDRLSNLNRRYGRIPADHVGPQELGVERTDHDHQ